MYLPESLTKVISLLLTVGMFALTGAFDSVRAQSSNTNSPNNTRKIANAQKYRDEGAKPATGRAGPANISARALLNRDRTTDLEVTTGEFDSIVVPPGTLSKIQLKSFDQNDGLRYARNFNNLNAGGYFRLAMNDVFHHQPLQVQANVRGIDGNRTGVVTLLTGVKLRPDLAAGNLAAPDQTLVGAPVNIAVTVNEINYDVGARANLVLYVNGTEDDRADGIWVDAGGTVSAAFVQRFSAPGTKQLEVKVESVAPSDYDTANNSVTGTIEVRQPGNPFRYYQFSGYDRTFEDRGRSQGFYRYDPAGPYNANSDWDHEWYNQGHDQAVYLNAWMPEFADFPFDITITETSDGQPVQVSRFDAVTNLYTYSYNYGDFTLRANWPESFNASSYTYLQVGNYEEIDNASGNRRFAQTWLYHGRYAGDVTYFSRGYARAYGNLTDGTAFFWSWNYDASGHNVNGTFVELGNEHGFQVTMTVRDGRTFTLSQTRPTQPFDTTHLLPLTCNDWDHSSSWGFPYFGRYCEERDYHATGRSFFGAWWEDVTP